MDEYLHTNFTPDADFVDGEIEERNLGQYDHGKIQAFITYLFTLHAKAWQTDVVPEQRIRVADQRVRIADIAVLRADAPREQVTTTPPLICIEILSPEDRLSRAKEVLADYLAMGVPNIWLIDPIYRAAFTFDTSGLREANPTQLTVPGTAIHLDLTEAFAAID